MKYLYGNSFKSTYHSIERGLRFIFCEFNKLAIYPFEKSEIKKLEDHGITGITDGVWYSRLELNDKGIAGCTKDDILGQLALYGILCVTA